MNEGKEVKNFCYYYYCAGCGPFILGYDAGETTACCCGARARKNK